MTNVRLFQIKEFADDNFEFEENSGGSQKRVENTVAKGEIAHYDFSFSHSVFKRLAMLKLENNGIFGNQVLHGSHFNYPCF